jgi:prevent-host-death family protein
MLVATITEAKNQLSALIDRVRGGESVVIVDRGIPVARLESAATGPADADGRIARLQRAGRVKPASTRPAVELLSSAPPRPRRGASAVAALLQARRESR